jgi:hypothetical protein
MKFEIQLRKSYRLIQTTIDVFKKKKIFHDL